MKFSPHSRSATIKNTASSHTARSRRMKIAAGAIGFSLLAAACTASDEEPPRPSASNTDEVELPAVPEGLEEFYEHDIDWESCDESYECGTLEVPMDYDNPDGDVFTLALGKVAAGEDAKGSLLINPGGPGGSGLELLESAAMMFGNDLLANYDIIGFDPRGVGESEPIVECISDEERDKQREQVFDPNTDEGLQEMVEEQRSFAAQCTENTGEALAFVDTGSAARDMDVIRGSLEEPKLDYLGFSYGTLLGATYADTFPDNVGHMVLDSVIDPTLTYEEVGQGQARGFGRAMDAYLEWCLDSSSCPVAGDVDSALNRIDDFMDGLDDNPLPTNDESRDLNSDSAMSGLILALYSKQSWAMLSQALDQAMNDRDGSMLLQFADISADRENDGTYANNSSFAFTAVNCLDYNPNPDIDEMREDAEELDEISSFFGPALAYGGMSCEGWPVEGETNTDPLTAEGSDTIVLIGTTRDPATPYEWAEALSEQLENNVLVKNDGDGHGAYGSMNTCIDEIVDDYFVNDVVPEEGITC